MRFFPRNNKGETLAETLVALMILGIGITVASTVISSSIRNMENTYNRILAVNLAREGLEAIHNIRETNWMKFSNNKRGCWNHLPGPIDADNCTPDPSGVDTAAITPGDYIVYLDDNKKWRLKKIDLQTDDEENITKLYRLEAITSGINEIINHANTSTIMIDNLGTDLDLSSIEKDIITPFKRVITLKYIKDDGSVDTGPNPATNNRLEIISKVSWTRNNQDFNVELKNRLSDYLGRSNLQE